MDAVSTDDVILTGMIIQDDTLELEGRGQHGGAVRRRDHRGDGVQEFVDGVIVDYMTTAAGTTAYEKWIGQYTGETEDPPTMTLEEALELRPCEETC